MQLLGRDWMAYGVLIRISLEVLGLSHFWVSNNLGRKEESSEHA